MPKLSDEEKAARALRARVDGFDVITLVEKAGERLATDYTKGNISDALRPLMRQGPVAALLTAELYQRLSAMGRDDIRRDLRGLVREHDPSRAELKALRDLALLAELDRQR